MKTIRISLAAPAALSLLLLASAPAEAQFGALKKAAAQAAGRAMGDTPAATPAAPASGPAFGENVLELTPVVLDRFARSLALDDSLQAEADRLESPAYREEYQRCETGLVTGDATYQGFAERVAEAYDAFVERTGGDATIEQYTEYQTTHLEPITREMEAYLVARCGVRPHTPVENIEPRAAEAGGFTPRQYAIVKERVLPFCRTPQPRVGRYVYADAEVEALVPRCAALLPALERTA